MGAYEDEVQSPRAKMDGAPSIRRWSGGGEQRGGARHGKDILSMEMPLLLVWSFGNLAMRFFVMGRLVFPAAHTTRPQSTCCSGASLGLRVTEVGLTPLT